MQIKVNLNIDLKNIKINRVIRYFILTDLLLFGGWGFIGPIFAVFILERIAGGSLIVIGAATAIYWITKSVIQIPMAMFLDKHEGERDDFIVLVSSFIIAGFTAMAYLLVKTVPGLFFVTLLQGIAFGFYIPAWTALFSRHLDKEHCSLDWSLDSTALGIATGITALMGGAIASWIGFEAVFILAGILCFTSAVILISVPDLILPRKTTSEGFTQDHTPAITGK